MLRLQQAGFEGRGGQNFQIVAADFGVGIFAGDDFALLGDADLAVHRAARLRNDGVIARPAAAADRAAAAVEQPQPHAVTLEHFDQPDLGLVEFPARGDEAAVLVAVGIAQHHFLDAAAAVDQLAIIMHRQQPVHDRGAGLQVLDGLEQRHDVERAAAGGIDETDLLQQQRYLQHVGHPLAHRDDALRDHVRAEPAVRLGSGMEHREFAQRLVAVFHEGRSQRPRIAQLGCKKRNPRVFAQGQIGHAGHRRIEQFRDRAFMHCGVLPHVETGEVNAETIQRTAQQPQPPARDHARIV